jgi:hypothetical protein
MRPPREHAERRLAGEQGAVIVEFAAVFIVFAMLLWGLISYGLVFAAQQSLTHAASDAARAGVGLENVDDARDSAERIVDEQLDWLARFGWLEFDKSQHVDVAPCSNATGQDCLTVEVAYDWGGHPIVPSILNVATPNRLSATGVVQFR